MITNVSDTRSRPVSYTFSGGRITKLEDPNGGVTGDTRPVTYTYTGSGMLDRVTDATGMVTDYDYTGNDLTRITLPGGRTVTIAYDGMHRATSVSRTGSGATETTTYDYNGDVESGGPYTTTVTDARGKRTTYRSDHAGRVRSATNHVLETISRQFDVNSNVIEMTDAGNTVPATYEFDDLNNATGSVSAAGVTTSAEYQGEGSGSTNGLWPYQVEDATDAQGKTSTYGYDTLGNPTSTANALGQSTSATYKTSTVPCSSSAGAKPGQMCTSKDRRGTTTTYVYSSVGDPTRVDHPAPLGDTTMTYDAVSRVRTRTDGKGQVATYTYDENDRVTSITYPGLRSVRFVRDPYGNVAIRIDTTFGAAQVWAYTYDQANRVLTVDGPGSLNDVTYTYDRVGNVLSVTDAGGITRYSYNDVNQPLTITDADGNVTRYTYRLGRSTWLERIAFSNGAQTTYTHDDDGRVETVQNREADGDIVEDLTYDRTEGTAERALVQTITSPTVTTRYTYDDASRLASAETRSNSTNAIVGDTWSYRYDPNSNRTRMTKSGSVTNYAFNAADQQTTGGWTFDANGSLVDGGSSGYSAASYNSLGQTDQLTVKYAGGAASQTFGGAGQSRWLSSGVRQLGATGAGITSTVEGSTSVRFTRDPNGRLISMKSSSGRFHYFHDGRGSVIGLTDGLGARVQFYSYEPYGRIAVTLGPVDQPFRWNGEYAFNDFAYKIGARYYDASQARWTQTDPVPGEPRYAYASGDPLNRADATGTIDCAIPWDDGDNGCAGGGYDDPGGYIGSLTPGVDTGYMFPFGPEWDNCLKGTAFGSAWTLGDALLGGEPSPHDFVSAMAGGCASGYVFTGSEPLF